MLSMSRWAVRAQLTCRTMSYQFALAIEEVEKLTVLTMAGVTSMHLDHRVSSAKYRNGVQRIAMHKIYIIIGI